MSKPGDVVFTSQIRTALAAARISEKPIPIVLPYRRFTVASTNS
jgi:hypothetical protein